MHVQDIFGVFYNLVKYTAPAFIFGILYTTIRTNDEKGSFSYAKHMRANWSNLFLPTIWWTLIYLLGCHGCNKLIILIASVHFASNLLTVMRHRTFGTTR